LALLFVPPDPGKKLASNKLNERISWVWQVLSQDSLDFTYPSWIIRSFFTDVAMQGAKSLNAKARPSVSMLPLTSEKNAISSDETHICR